MRGVPGARTFGPFRRGPAAEAQADRLQLGRLRHAQNQTAAQDGGLGGGDVLLLEALEEEVGLGEGNGQYQAVAGSERLLVRRPGGRRRRGGMHGHPRRGPQILVQVRPSRPGSGLVARRVGTPLGRHVPGFWSRRGLGTLRRGPVVRLDAVAQGRPRHEALELAGTRLPREPAAEVAVFLGRAEVDDLLGGEGQADDAGLVDALAAGTEGAGVFDGRYVGVVKATTERAHGYVAGHVSPVTACSRHEKVVQGRRGGRRCGFHHAATRSCDEKRRESGTKARVLNGSSETNRGDSRLKESTRNLLKRTASDASNDVLSGGCFFDRGAGRAGRRPTEARARVRIVRRWCRRCARFGRDCFKPPCPCWYRES